MRLALLELKAALVHVLRRVRLVPCEETQVRRFIPVGFIPFCVIGGGMMVGGGMIVGVGMMVGGGMRVGAGAGVEEIIIKFLTILLEKMCVGRRNFLNSFLSSNSF